MLEKILERPLDFKEIQPVHPKNQSWAFIGRTDVEGLILKLKLCYFGHLMRRASGENTLILGTIEGRRRRGRQRMRWLDCITDSMDMGLGGLRELVMPSSHLILCHPLLLQPSIFPSIRLFSNELVLHGRRPRYWSFSISPSNEYSGLISVRMDWLSSYYLLNC